MTDFRLDGAKVLVVEDEYFIADDLARALDAAGADPIGPAGTVDQARRLLKNQRVDAAILDLNLRGDMAVDFVEQLSAAGVPCVIVSGYGRGSLPESLEAIPSLEKPVSYEKVIEMVRNVLGREAVQT